MSVTIKVCSEINHFARLSKNDILENNFEITIGNAIRENNS